MLPFKKNLLGEKDLKLIRKLLLFPVWLLFGLCFSKILFVHFPGPRKHQSTINNTTHDSQIVSPTHKPLIINMGPGMLLAFSLGILLCIAGKHPIFLTLFDARISFLLHNVSKDLYLTVFSRVLSQRSEDLAPFITFLSHLRCTYSIQTKALKSGTNMII